MAGIHRRGEQWRVRFDRLNPPIGLFAPIRNEGPLVRALVGSRASTIRRQPLAIGGSIGRLRVGDKNSLLCDAPPESAETVEYSRALISATRPREQKTRKWAHAERGGASGRPIPGGLAEERAQCHGWLRRGGVHRGHAGRGA